MISISINPNFEKDDVDLIRGGSKSGVESLEKKIEKYFLGGKVVIVEKGRDGMQLLIKALDLKSDDEVLVQAFTCSVVPMAIMTVGAKVVYVDIDDNYNMDLVDLKKKITSKTKLVVVQHTFGMPVKMDELREVVGEKIKIIEDLAHGLGNEYKEKKLGTWGEAAILSFGRDKVISGVWGGAVLANENVIKKIKKMTENLSVRDKIWVKGQVDYVLLMELVMKYYSFGIGKLMHWWAKKDNWFDQPLSKMEKNGKSEKIYKNLPDELVCIIDHQWNKLNKYIERRKIIAKKYADALGEEYNDNCSYLRYSVEVYNPNSLREFAASKNIFLGDWYNQVISPKSIDPKIFGYKWGSCPVAEKTSQRIVNLPTNPRLSNQEIDRVISIIKEWKSKK
ncbi:hypothetical protein CO009_03180 [Candidatus Shapirobacteria bacterium CG_4_8_14_3_um_filter_35_11]|uniref:Aminotransferase DegT n=1 Tax=Candidatus Shapirobacteria bacterium CG_4_8_14_3_um_filter_35_11 TaxID=1974874 RepID=A0A2M8GJ62_9BACT|nr:MAG: hypothetical protein CO009_03180 [Candidatus Shapirobacteria bacterium CG_4_8_14_3_um_filter_35_11]